MASPDRARRSRPLLVALTGGIGSGKSTVADCFAELGTEVVDADLIAREVVAPGSPVLAALVALAGADILDAAGALDRAALRQRMLRAAPLRHAVEALLHPEILRRLWARAEAARGPYVIVVVPLLVETGQAERADRVLLVDVPEAVQRARLAARPGLEAWQIDALIAAQAEPGARRAVADDIIDNSADLDTLRRRVRALHEGYLALADVGLPS